MSETTKRQWWMDFRTTVTETKASQQDQSPCRRHHSELRRRESLSASASNRENEVMIHIK